MADDEEVVFEVCTVKTDKSVVVVPNHEIILNKAALQMLQKIDHTCRAMVHDDYYAIIIVYLHTSLSTGHTSLWARPRWRVMHTKGMNDQKAGYIRS